MFGRILSAETPMAMISRKFTEIEESLPQRSPIHIISTISMDGVVAS